MQPGVNICVCVHSMCVNHCKCAHMPACILTDSERRQFESEIGGCRAVCQCTLEGRKKGGMKRRQGYVCVRVSQDESSIFAGLSNCLALKAAGEMS